MARRSQQSYFVADDGQEVAILERGGHGRHSDRQNDRDTTFLIRDHHMDIFNRPPAISEDTVQYRLYPPQQSTDKVSVLTLATVLKSYADDLLPGFLWHRDPFELKIASDVDGWVLEGTMRVGDCVDDEWCVVWLLREISKKWDIAIRSVSHRPPPPPFIVFKPCYRVSDSDGEFLLIEAAEVLPSWVTPPNAENRVRTNSR